MNYSKRNINILSIAISIVIFATINIAIKCLTISDNNANNKMQNYIVEK